MREIHYIDTDEEIITAVSRLRRSSQSENVFVFPRRALILQSIVNLRLLEREAEKLSKTIIVMTQDEAGRKLAEKAGLLVEDYRDRTQLQSGEDRVPQSEAASQVITVPNQRERNIGSASFYSAGRPFSPESRPLSSRPMPPVVPPAPKQLRVRNASPTRPPSLNSMRDERVPQPVMAPPRVMTSSALPKPAFAQVPRTAAVSERLRRFMQDRQPFPVETTPPQRSSLPPKLSKHVSQSKSVWGIWVLGSLLLGVIVFGVWYVFFPKALITVIPQSAEQVVHIAANGVTDTTKKDAESLPVRTWEIEKSISITDEATGTGGTSASSTGKARGTVRIYNDFSQEAQPLVATTRFQTADGKVFRLAQGVVVPGMSDQNGEKKRGVVEAMVIADASGPEYNLAPTHFTIPGFQGSPKYEKFSAESIQAFTGGGVTTSSDQHSISDADKSRVALKADAQAKEYALTEAKNALHAGEVAITDSIQATRLSEMATLKGKNGSDFTYEARYRIQLFFIDETAVRQRIAEERVTSDGVTLAPKDFDVRYTSLLPKYENGRIDLTIESIVHFQSQLDGEKIKGALLGLNEDGIREFLKIHPEIERLQVEFNPQLFITTIPRSPERVTVEVGSAT